jgi:hypothetical protein
MKLFSCKYSSPAVAFICLGLACFAVQAQEPNADIYGKWKITKELGGSITGLTDKDVRRLIGKPMIISAKKFAFNGKVCMHPRYDRSVDDTAVHFYREWRADSDELPLGDRVTIIETECNTLYPIRKNHIIVAEDGIFFEAVRLAK